MRKNIFFKWKFERAIVCATKNWKIHAEETKQKQKKNENTIKIDVNCDDEKQNWIEKNDDVGMWNTHCKAE